MVWVCAEIHLAYVALALWPVCVQETISGLAMRTLDGDIKTSEAAGWIKNDCTVCLEIITNEFFSPCFQLPKVPESNSTQKINRLR